MFYVSIACYNSCIYKIVQTKYRPICNVFFCIIFVGHSLKTDLGKFCTAELQMMGIK